MSADIAEAEEPGDISFEVARHGSKRTWTAAPPSTGITPERPHRRRDRDIAEQGDLDHYRLHLVTSGALQGNFHGPELLAGVGDICILDLAQVATGWIEAGSTMSMALQRQALEAVAGKRNLHGAVLKARWPMTRLIASYVRELCLLDTPLPDTQALAAQEAVLTLVSAALKDHGPGDAARASPLGAGLHQRITEFLARNIYLLDLSPDFLCRRFNVSRAHLYRAFAEDGGVAKVLRDMRLDAVYRELTQTDRAPRSITELAYTLGFSSSNQLLRSFRARFGVTPSEARAHGVKTPELARKAVDVPAWIARLSGGST
ncbi:helix-turn-helix domain-containing protein [Pinirhizobacter sp.]|jgi:AraC-like DNA-binding protein|uniref:helix-turn-helix domain-containing protein n=1 Tax=Pinirhizobacter sp. TaxID=2950432 RepID=UPI0039C965AA